MTKFGYRVAGIVVGALFCSAVFVAGQSLSGEQSLQPVPPAARAQFFVGTVVELDTSHIKVTRTLVGRPTESRNFNIDAATKMNKSTIKLHNRVIVRYKRLPEGDLALEIQPRPVIGRTPKA
jgi:hypothetical protein